MKKRILGLLLALCLLMPAGVFAVRDSSFDGFAYFRDYLILHGESLNGVYTVRGVEKMGGADGSDVPISVILSYDTKTDRLILREEAKLDGNAQSVELVIPSSLNMPYSAAQTVSVGLASIQNEAKIGSDFTREGDLSVTGETYGIAEIPKLFANSAALLLRHVQDHIFYGSGYTIADLGFTALFEELYGNHTHVAATKNAVAATCTEAGFSGDPFCAICGEPMGTGRTLPALGHKAELKNAKAATATQPGYTGDEVCAVCGEVLKKGEEIPALGLPECDGGKDCPSKVFTDVNQALWYHLPIDWAVTSKVTTGLTATTFGPDASCTRAQMVTFLWRAVGEPEPKSASNPFVDVPAGQYYAKAVLWALENGITTGMDAKHFAPNNTVTRAQTVTFLWRLMQEPAPKGGRSFPDVPAGQYYAKAVMWAVENGITNGMGNGLFAPNDNCTRAQIVTFLYRTVVK